MKSWTLISNKGDRIERIVKEEAFGGKKTKFSYWGVLNGERIFGHLNKLKKSYNEFHNEKLLWEEIFE